jgi:hypothetical protein
MSQARSAWLSGSSSSASLRLCGHAERQVLEDAHGVGVGWCLVPAWLGSSPSAFRRPPGCRCGLAHGSRSRLRGSPTCLLIRALARRDHLRLTRTGLSWGHSFLRERADLVPAGVNGHRFLPMYGHRFSPPAAIFSPHWRPWVLPMTWGSRFRRSGGRRP